MGDKSMKSKDKNKKQSAKKKAADSTKRANKQGGQSSAPKGT